VLVRALIVPALMICGLPLYAQSWGAVRGLKTGDRVIVLDNSGQTHKGALISVSADGISVKTGNGEEAVERARVRRVRVRSSSRRARNAVIGGAIGLAAGITIDQSLGAYFRNESGESAGARAVTYIAPIGLFGAIGGAFPAYRTVYRVR
jgi:hypothetical protein